MWRALYGVLLGLCPSVLMAADDTLTYAVTDESWAPYWIVQDGRVEGVLQDVMLALRERVPVRLEASHPLPPLRAQKLFREGRLQIECCVSRAWRSAPRQTEVSLWSIPVLEAQEMLLFAPGRAFPFSRLEDLQGRSIATVRGYGYVGSEYFQRRDVADTMALIYNVAQGRSDAGIVDRLEWSYLRRHRAQFDMPQWQVEEGPLINQSELRIRLHRDQAQWLGALNRAIASLHKDGSMARILARYLSPQDLEEQAHMAAKGEIR
ncbi:ABC transporter substrate-binding protein [Pseudomonas sp. 8Z]|uniref:substrate-binding periplasmic protein n=1 Tax=Pseudomonas sp. 8Z TaxID=2653166 RepID=UPI0021148AFF|nr:transporter substrate-binding domain-containing protein [Pseudomonas sp. 8Z]